MTTLLIALIIAASPPAECPSGNGTYCGEAVGRDPRFLWLCFDGQWQTVEQCPAECVMRPPGKPDYCDPMGECVDDGAKTVPGPGGTRSPSNEGSGER